MNRGAFLTASAWLLGALVAQAADPARSAYKHLKPLEWLIGDWVGEYTAPSDLGAVKKDDLVKAHWSIRWGIDRQFMIADGFHEVQGRRLNNSHEIVGWDKDKEQVIHWIFGFQGAGSGTWSPQNDKAVLQVEINSQEGKLKGTAVLQNKGPDTFIWEVKEATLEGKASPGLPPITLHRRKGVATGDLWKFAREKFVGTWEGEGVLDSDAPALGLKEGDKFTMRVKWKSDGPGLAMTMEGEFRGPDKSVKTSGRSLMGWDPLLQQVRLVESWSDGTMGEYSFTRVEGTSLFGTYVTKRVGQAGLRQPVRFDFSETDSLVITSTSGGKKGEVLSSWKRVKE